MKSSMEEIIHLPDLLFVQRLSKQYNVNRGIFNTIDIWFYNQGILNIIERRKLILTFLETLIEHTTNDRRRHKFGNGGLTIKLEEYFSHKEHIENSKLAAIL